MVFQHQHMNSLAYKTLWIKTAVTNCTINSIEATFVASESGIQLFSPKFKDGMIEPNRHNWNTIFECIYHVFQEVFFHEK